MANIEVLLRRSIESLGRVGEVVRVKPGYARNYLFPHGLAARPTKENQRLAEKDKATEAAAEAEQAKVRAELLAKIAAASVTIEAKSNPEGHLFGSVGAKQVADALVAKGFAIEERHLRFEPVKALGEYDVLVHLAPGAEATTKLWVVDDVTKKAGKGADASAGAEEGDADAEQRAASSSSSRTQAGGAGKKLRADDDKPGPGGDGRKGGKTRR
jgi:large subunit ribosomal protein L9